MPVNHVINGRLEYTRKTCINRYVFTMRRKCRSIMDFWRNGIARNDIVSSTLLKTLVEFEGEKIMTLFATSLVTLRG